MGEPAVWLRHSNSRPNEAIPLTGHVISKQPIDDRTEQLLDLLSRVQMVEQEESKSTSFAQDEKESASNRVTDPPLHEQVEMPGFDQTAVNFRKWGNTYSQMPANEINRFHALAEFASGQEVVHSIPVMLQIGRSNKCNFKCVYCPDHRVGNDLPRSELTGETWEKLLKLVHRSRFASFHGVSEFLIDPDFFEIVDFCTESRVGLSINTNGSVCTPKHIKALAEYPDFLDMTFSIDAASPEMFTRIRGWDFWRVLGNIRQYLDAFADRKGGNTNVSFSFVITRSTVREMTPFVYLAKAFGVNYVRYFRLHEYDSFGWQVTSKDGTMFDYRDECTSNFASVYNRELEKTRKAAEILGIHADLPGPHPEPLPIILEEVSS